MKSTKEILLDSKLNLIKLTSPEGKKWNYSTSLEWDARIRNLRAARLFRQAATQIHQNRISQAETMFHHFKNLEDAVEFLMGEPFSRISTGPRQNYSYIYNHHTREYSNTWGNKPEIFIKSKFRWKTLWKVKQLFNLDLISLPIPEDIINALIHLYSINFFNTVMALESSDHRVMILGELWSLAPNLDGTTKNSGEEAFFLIGQFEGQK